jgi:two-component system CheB/CheR fusion protein
MHVRATASPPQPIPFPKLPTPLRERDFAWPPNDKIRVLIVEDNVDGADTLAVVLDRGDRLVHIAYDGRGGLEEAIKFEPHVCILDIGLPGIDGFKLAEGIRDALGSAPLLIALTGYTSPTDVQRALAAGFDYHLAKPASLAELMQLVETGWRES